MRTVPNAGVSPFAFLGRGPKAAEDDQEKETKGKKAKADETDEDEDETKSKGSKAEDGDDDQAKGSKAAEDEEDDAPKGKKAKKADAEDDDEDERDEGDADAKAARARERRRIKAIMLSDAGRANPAAAAHLATTTAMPRTQAIGLLAAMSLGQNSSPGASSRDTLRSRMSDVPNPSVGADGGRGAPSTADAIIAAGKKRRGEA